MEFVVDEEESDWKDEALERLPSVLQQLQTNGYALKDIAILVRTNNEGAQVANYLLQYKEEHPDDGFSYDLISDEALYVNSSAAVRFLIAILHHLKSPDNPTWAQMLLFSYRILTSDWQRASLCPCLPRSDCRICTEREYGFRTFPNLVGRFRHPKDDRHARRTKCHPHSDGT